MKDEIIQEVWQAKDAIAAKYKHNVETLVRHLRRLYPSQRSFGASPTAGGDDSCVSGVG